MNYALKRCGLTTNAKTANLVASPGSKTPKATASNCGSRRQEEFVHERSLHHLRTLHLRRDGRLLARHYENTGVVFGCETSDQSGDQSYATHHARDGQSNGYDKLLQ